MLQFRLMIRRKYAKMKLKDLKGTRIFYHPESNNFKQVMHFQSPLEYPKATRERKMITVQTLATGIVSELSEETNVVLCEVKQKIEEDINVDDGASREVDDGKCSESESEE